MGATRTFDWQRIQKQIKAYYLEWTEEIKLLISFDPNLRESLWDSLENAKEQMDCGLRYCNILKISDNEIQWFTEKEDLDEGGILRRSTTFR